MLDQEPYDEEEADLDVAPARRGPAPYKPSDAKHRPKKDRSLSAAELYSLIERLSQRDGILKPAEVAAIFRVGPKEVGRWNAQGRLPATRTPGGHRRFRLSVVRGLYGQPEDWAAMLEDLLAIYQRKLRSESEASD